MKYPEELLPKAKYEIDVFERVSMDTGKELIAEVERLRAELYAWKQMGQSLHASGLRVVDVPNI